jgi:hypothetical protein
MKLASNVQGNDEVSSLDVGVVNRAAYDRVKLEVIALCIA